MELKGHIILLDGRSLCGSKHEVKESKLYGLQCGECFENASFLLRGGKINRSDISKEDLDKVTA